MAVMVLGSGLIFVLRPSFALSAESDVLRTVSAEFGKSGMCPNFWTSPYQNFGTYGFSNGGADEEWVWLDRAERQAKGRGVRLIVGSLTDKPRCLQRVTLQTPRFAGNLAFVNWGSAGSLGIVALRREGPVWRTLNMKWNSRGPVY
jgi:hypothetical protein